MESGPKYIITKEGLIKFLVIAFGCVTFALLADSGWYDVSTRMRWVFAAFVVSFSISVLFYFFRVTGISDNMNCSGPFSYDGFDFIWSWFCTIWCTAAAITFAVNFPSIRKYTKTYNELVSSVVFAFLTAVTYAVEAFVLKDRAPGNIGYVATRHGWWKTLLVGFGAAAFGLLVDSGYSWCGGGCYSGITYALSAYIIGWGVTVLIWFAHMAGIGGSGQADKFNKFEFAWSVLCVLLFWTASSCFAAYMRCSGNDFSNFKFCQKRLSGVVIGFLTGVFYIIDAVFHKP